ncbi:MAG TPA: 50S ribosomal protein L11 methyltransferase [Xanthomonadales bacterium]|nr:50S ribosomal protein L11 methyltransferase [Xanthomonadales bacterium]
MPWFELSLSVDRTAVPAAEAALEAAGALSITLQDHADSPVLEPGPGATPLWPVVQVRGLFEHTTDRVAVAGFLQEALGISQPGAVHWLEVGDRDWERAWMDRFRPMRFGRRLWVVPGGMTIPPAPENIEILLDPGLAFGTGTHPTTAMCLQWLDAQDLSGKRVVDYGCGSGILAIASALLGAAEIIAVDNDPQALEATAANAARNAVGEQIHGRSPEQFATLDADVVLANILAGPLVELAPVLSGCAAPGARIILSGLLEEQLDRVAAAYRPACEVTGSATLDGWARLDLRRNP